MGHGGHLCVPGHQGGKRHPICSTFQLSDALLSESTTILRGAWGLLPHTRSAARSLVTPDTVLPATRKGQAADPPGPVTGGCAVAAPPPPAGALGSVARLLWSKNKDADAVMADGPGRGGLPGLQDPRGVLPRIPPAHQHRGSQGTRGWEASLLTLWPGCRRCCTRPDQDSGCTSLRIPCWHPALDCDELRTVSDPDGLHQVWHLQAPGSPSLQGPKIPA